MGTSDNRDPAASMSLLSRVIADSLDPGYHAASKTPSTPSWPLKIVLLLVCIVLVFTATVSAKNLRQRDASIPGAMKTLASETQRAASDVDQLEQEVLTLDEQLRVLRSELGLPEASVNPSAQLATSNSRVTGSGLTIRITDVMTATGSSPIQDTDLRSITNALWSGGAEAVAINGMRIGPMTTIRMAGSTIMVNMKPIVSPYVIEAIGDDPTMREALSTGTAAYAVRNLEESLGMSISVTTSASLTLGPLASGQLLFAEAVDEKKE